MGGDNQQFGDVGNNVIAGSVKGDRNILGEKVHVVNNTIHLTVGEDAEKRLEKILSLTTEVSPQIGGKSSVHSEEVERMKGDLEKLVGIVDELRNKGGEGRELYAGSHRISKVEMLLKKAVLLKTEADQLLMDQFQKNSASGMQQGDQTIQIDLNDMVSGIDEDEYLKLMSESLDLLKEANKEEPTNIEVLLHMAQVVGSLEPDHPEDVRRLLAKALTFLKNPKTDEDWFMKAEATFLMATAGDETHPDLLKDAREIFKRLNRSEWVRQCDDLLASFDDINENPFSSDSAGSFKTEQHQNPLEFHPVGRWQINVNDGSVIDAHFYQNGLVQGSQQNSMTWQSFTFSGQWAYIPYSRLLQIQGTTNYGYPVMQVIGIRQKEGEVFLGFDMNGFQYRLQKVI